MADPPGEEDTLRIMALVAWFPALFTYLYAILMMYGDNPFRRMVNGVVNLPMKLIFLVAALVSVGTIVRLLWAGTPWWDAPNSVFLGGFLPLRRLRESLGAGDRHASQHARDSRRKFPRWSHVVSPRAFFSCSVRRWSRRSWAR